MYKIKTKLEKKSTKRWIKKKQFQLHRNSPEIRSLKVFVFGEEGFQFWI